VNNPFTKLKNLKTAARVLAEFKNQSVPVLLIKIKTSMVKVPWYV
jgi:hypothetical protein